MPIVIHGLNDCNLIPSMVLSVPFANLNVLNRTSPVSLVSVLFSPLCWYRLVDMNDNDKHEIDTQACP